MGRTESPAPTAQASETQDDAKAGSVKAGLPEVDEGGFMKFLPLFGVFLVVPRAIGYGIAYSIHKYGKTALYDKNIAALGEDAGYLYLAAVVISFAVHWVNNFPGMYKSMIMRMGSGNLRANMMIFKEAGSNADAPMVLLETEGPIGSYNRANRSLTHMTENSLPVILAIALAGRVFPFPTFALAVLFGVGRILHQAGYATGYGAHAPGFMCAFLSMNILEMLCLIAGLQNLGSTGATRTEL